MGSQVYSFWKQEGNEGKFSCIRDTTEYADLTSKRDL